MYVMTLGESLIFNKFLENIIQFGWLDTPTSSSPLQFFELDNVKTARNRLSFFSFFYFILFSFQFTSYIFLFIEIRVSVSHVTQEERCRRF